MVTLYSYDCFILNASSLDDAKNEIILAWGDIGSSILYLVSDKKMEVFPKLSNCGWLVVVLSEYHYTYFPPVGEPQNFVLLRDIYMDILGLLESINCLLLLWSSTSRFNVSQRNMSWAFSETKKFKKKHLVDCDYLGVGSFGSLLQKDGI